VEAQPSSQTALPVDRCSLESESFNAALAPRPFADGRQFFYEGTLLKAEASHLEEHDEEVREIVQPDPLVAFGLRALRHEQSPADQPVQLLREPLALEALEYLIATSDRH